MKKIKTNLKIELNNLKKKGNYLNNKLMKIVKV